MPGGDASTVARLLHESEELARLGSLRMAGLDAPAALRAFTHAVEAGGRIWTLATDPSNDAAGDVMDRMLEITRAVRDTYACGLWPGPGPAEGRLMNIADQFNRAAALLPDRPTFAKAASAQHPMTDGRVHVRLRVLHTLYVEAHGLRVALNIHAADLARQLKRDSLRRTPMELRADPAAAAGMADRLDLVERLAGQHLRDHRRRASEATAPDRRPGRSVGLPAALASWDIEAHRALAGFPAASNVTCVARVQALITTTTGVLAETAAADAQLEWGTVDRFLGRADAAQVAWTQTARRWSELASPAVQIHPPLRGAAAALRTALAAAVHTEDGWADPEVIAGRVDLAITLHALHLALAGGIDVSHVIRRVAVTEPSLTAPASIIGMRTQREVERAADRGESRYPGVEWVSEQQMRTNQRIPLPDPARHGLVNLADVTTATSTRAHDALILPTRHLAPEPPGPTTQVSRVRVEHGRSLPQPPMLDTPSR